MDQHRAANYINALYEKRTISRSSYIDSSELKKFGTVIDEDVSRALKLLVRLTGARNVLEIGTSIGYSTLTMASAVKTLNGRITTIEYDQQTARQAIKNFEREGVNDIIEVVVGDAREIVPKMQGTFDLIFQDVGDKGLYQVLLDDCIRLLKPGGLLLAEDTLFPVMDLHGMRPATLQSIHRFNEFVAGSPYLESTILPIGDGLTVAMKIDTDMGDKA
jgi:Predicted O-methyltransferase